MITLTKTQIDTALSEIASPLAKYCYLQTFLREIDVSRDKTFQKKYSGFYHIRHRNRAWKKFYFSLLERSKFHPLSFSDVLNAIHRKTGRVEASFSSKLVATIDLSMPVIDKFVLQNANLVLPVYGENRIERVELLYETLREKIDNFSHSENGVYLVDSFLRRFPCCHITKTKMIDFVLWKIR